MAKQNEIDMIVQFLQGGSKGPKEVENNVQLKKSESNKEMINKNEGRIQLQMGTTGVKNTAITKVSNKRPNENAPSFNQPIKKMKSALNTNPNSRQDETVSNIGELKVREEKQPTDNSKIPEEEEHIKKRQIIVKTDQGNEYKKQSTIEAKVVEDQQNNNLMMKEVAINTKKDFPNSVDNANPTVKNVSIIL